MKERLDFARGKLGSGVAQSSAVMDRDVGCEMNPLTLGDDPCEIFTVLVNGQGFIPRSSFNKEILGATAAKIRSYRKPEPFKGKGIKYDDEFIFRKEGKKK